jgi:hypothetical protein
MVGNRDLFAQVANQLHSISPAVVAVHRDRKLVKPNPPSHTVTAVLQKLQAAPVIIAIERYARRR